MSPVWIGFCCGVVAGLALGAFLMVVVRWLVDRAEMRRDASIWITSDGAARRGRGRR